MTEEDKELLLKDLCARQPYGVKVQYNNEIYDIDYISALYEEVHLDIPDNYTIGISEIKPYLRPLSSMTPEEYEEMGKAIQENYISPCGEMKPGESPLTACVINQANNLLNWIYKKHFDYRDLIDKGLALEAPDNLYK